MATIATDMANLFNRGQAMVEEQDRESVDKKQNPATETNDEHANISRLRISAEADNFNAMTSYGYALLRDNPTLGVKRNPKEAVKLFTHAAEEGNNPEAHFQLARLSHYGIIGKRDLGEAIEHYISAAEQNHGAAQTGLKHLHTQIQSMIEKPELRDTLRGQFKTPAAVEPDKLDVLASRINDFFSSKRENKSPQNDTGGVKEQVIPAPG